ncbi:hypothetical protein Tco_0221693 [Tanacetum coccineum]
MSTNIVNLDLFDGGSFKLWQKKPWLNPVNVSSSEMMISFEVATSSMLFRIHSWTYIKTIPLLGNFGKLSRYLAQNKYAKVIGNLMYAMTCTRPDIAYAVGRLSRHTSSPDKKHWDAVNRVFKYLKKTMDYGLEYSGDPSVLEGYTDASWITDQEDYRQPMPPISVHRDSQSTLSRAYNQVDNGKSMHIGLRHRQVNQLINDGVITVSFLRSSKNLVDPFTKGLPRQLIKSQGVGLKPVYNYENSLDKVHLSECGSEAASYEFKGLALKHSEKPR